MKHLEPITDFLRQAGAENIHLAHGGKHPRVVYQWQGRERFYVVSNSPGDLRATKNALSDLRRQLGLTPKKQPAEVPPDSPPFHSLPLTGWHNPPADPAPAPEMVIETAVRSLLEEAPVAPPTGEAMTPTEIVAPARESAPPKQPAPNPETLRQGRDPRLSPNSGSRTHPKVPYAEVEPLLDRAVAVTGSDRAQVMHTVGYTAGVIGDWEAAGRAPLRSKYILLGLLATLEVPPPQVEPRVEFREVMVPVEALPLEIPVNPFTFDETTALFGVLNGFPVEAGVRRGLIGKLAQELARS